MEFLKLTIQKSPRAAGALRRFSKEKQNPPSTTNRIKQKSSGTEQDSNKIYVNQMDP